MVKNYSSKKVPDAISAIINSHSRVCNRVSVAVFDEKDMESKLAVEYGFKSVEVNEYIKNVKNGSDCSKHEEEIENLKSEIENLKSEIENFKEEAAKEKTEEEKTEKTEEEKTEEEKTEEEKTEEEKTEEEPKKNRSTKSKR